MPKVSNSNCFSFRDINGIHVCSALNGKEAECKDCKFYKDKDDPRNNALMELFHRWSPDYPKNQRITN